MAVLEREKELAALAAGAEAAAAGAGRLVVVEGTAGLGKTTLLRAAAVLARRRDMRVLSAGGRELEAALAFGVVRQLFEAELVGAGDRRRAALLAGPAAMAGELVAGGRAPARGGEELELELLHALSWLAANLADEAPLALLVDDAQWADPSSLRFLLYLAQRVEPLPVLLVVAARPGEPGAPAELLTALAAAAATRLAPAPLGRAATARLVRDRRPGASAAFVAACHEATTGNPFLVGELLSALEAEGVEPGAEKPEHARLATPSSLLRATVQRLGRLAAGARELAEAVAVLGDGTPLRRAAALAGLSAEDTARAADTLAGVAILTPGDTPGFVHPLLRDAVLAEVPAAERGARHLAAARLLADEGAAPEAVAAQLLPATPSGEAWAVDELRAAAAAALERGAGDSAARYLRRALEEPPRPEDRAGVLLTLAEAEGLGGDTRAIEHVLEAVRRLRTPHERGEALLRLAWMLWCAGLPAEASAAAERAVAEHPDPDGEIAARAGTLRVALGSLLGEVPETGAPPVAVDVAERASTPVEREVATQVALSRLLRCEPYEGVRDLARAALGDGAMLAAEGVTLTFSVAASVLLWCDDLDVAEAEIEAAVEDCRRRGAHMALAYVLWGRSWPRLWRGRVADAAADVGSAVAAWRGGWSGQLPMAVQWWALALSELGGLDEAEEVLGEAPPPDGSLYDVGPMLARGRLALQRGDARAAWDLFARAEPRARGYPFFHNPAIQPWRSEAALAALRAGAEADARRLAGEELELARRFGAPRPLGIALRAAALVHGDEELAAEAVEVLERSPSQLELARALVDLGAVRRAAGRRVEAREPLRRALDLATRMGAVATADRARAELAAAGGRPRRAAITGVAALTPSERRVAELAAAGLSNPEIAQELFVARKTVEFHLAGVYRKLGARSRADLAGLLG